MNLDRIIKGIEYNKKLVELYQSRVDSFEKQLKRHNADPKKLINEVCNELGWEYSKLTNARRFRTYSTRRQILMYFLYESDCFTLKAIGEAFGGRDHSTVINARKNIMNAVYTNDSLILAEFFEIETTFNEILNKEE
jgi:chromosomal replication initiator protein